MLWVFSAAVKDSITVLANANLIFEKQRGRMIALSVAEDVVIPRDKFSEQEWDAVRKTVDLVGRVKSTEQYPGCYKRMDGGEGDGEGR